MTSGNLWLLGGWLDGQARDAFWAAALLLEYMGPALTFRVPGLRRSSTTDWNVDGGHLAERCSLFVIIALGESVVVTGSSFAETLSEPLALGGFNYEVHAVEGDIETMLKIPDSIKAVADAVKAAVVCISMRRSA